MMRWFANKKLVLLHHRKRAVNIVSVGVGRLVVPRGDGVFISEFAASDEKVGLSEPSSANDENGRLAAIIATASTALIARRK